MPVDIRIIDQGLGVMLRTSGTVSGAELVKAHEEFFLENMKPLSTIRYWYADHTEAEFVSFTADHIQQLTEIAVKISQINKNIVVSICSPQMLIFGMSRMWETYAERTGWIIKLFRERNEAKAWLREILHEDLTFE